MSEDVLIALFDSCDSDDEKDGNQVGARTGGRVRDEELETSNVNSTYVYPSETQSTYHQNYID